MGRMARIAPTDLAALLATTSRLLAACTPANMGSERRRLEAEAEQGRFVMPAFSYVAEASVAAATEWAATLAAAPITDPLLAERLDEIRLEGAIARAAGAPALVPLAALRFGAPTAEAGALARTWEAGGDDGPPPPADCETDGPEPSSLASALKRRIFEEQLDFRVAVHPDLLALAATGADCIYVAQGVRLSREDVRRTVVHEIEGHAAPRTRARRLGHPILSLGTRGGHDEQEGFALFCEERAGCLSTRRKWELALRHHAVLRMLDGACFADLTRWLVEERGRTPAQAVRLALRIFRGSDGTFPGLGRERVYLTSFVRVRRHLGESPNDEAMLRSGQVSLSALRELRNLLSGTGDAHV